MHALFADLSSKISPQNSIFFSFFLIPVLRNFLTGQCWGKVVYDEFYPRYSKPLIDRIDCILAQHYGFTHEELDYIINYDIKYRMGKELDTED